MNDDVKIYCAYDKLVDIDTLVPNPRNPNQHPKKQIELLAKIIKTQGWRAPITVSNQSGCIVRGHGRLLAAKQLGLTEAPVDYQDYATEAEEWADLIADNKLAELADIDKTLLSELMADAGDMAEFTGYTDDEIDALFNSVNPEITQEDNFDVDIGEIKQPKTQPGDMWILGGHRLLCGDATHDKDMATLMDGKFADMVFTDPPYNVSYVGKTKNALTIDNDAMTDDHFRMFLSAAYHDMFAALKDGGVTYICHADSTGHIFREEYCKAGFELKQVIIWAKNQFVLGRQDYQWQHEPILYGWKPGAAHTFLGGRTQSTLWEIDRPQRNAEHPTMKPIELCGRAIRNSSRDGEIVLDPFGGSGSTLIACEQLKRKCCMLELDPVYCDVIVNRYMEYTSTDNVYVLRNGAQIPYAQL